MVERGILSNLHLSAFYVEAIYNIFGSELEFISCQFTSCPSWNSSPKLWESPKLNSRFSIFCGGISIHARNLHSLISTVGFSVCMVHYTISSFSLWDPEVLLCGHYTEILKSNIAKLELHFLTRCNSQMH